MNITNNLHGLYDMLET